MVIFLFVNFCVKIFSKHSNSVFGFTVIYYLLLLPVVIRSGNVGEKKNTLWKSENLGIRIFVITSSYQSLRINNLYFQYSVTQSGNHEGVCGHQSLIHEVSQFRSATPVVR